MRPVTFWVMPPSDPTAPKNALQFPWNTVGPGPGHWTPLNVVFPVPVHPVKSPVSKPPLTSVGCGAACAGPATVKARPTAVATPAIDCHTRFGVEPCCAIYFPLITVHPAFGG